jgi:undecaprenyl-diphosphatase
VDLFQAIILGLVQGLTEFLPISSSAHLRIVASIFGWEDPGAAFTAVTQLGTEAAVVIYFRADLWAIAFGWTRALVRPELRRSHEALMGWYLIVATVPIAILGFTFEHQIETGARNLWLIGASLILFAFVLLYADRRGRHERPLEDLQVRDGVLVGLAQSLALIPGVSRSGATMSAGLLLGLQRPAAARFGFLLAVPAVVLSGFFQLAGIVNGDGGNGEPLVNVAVATVVAFVVGYAAIAWLLAYLSHHSVAIFVAYRVALGTLVLGLLAAGVIS